MAYEAVVESINALVRLDRAFEPEILLAVFAELGWESSGTWPFPRDVTRDGVSALVQPDETGFFVDFVLYEMPLEDEDDDTPDRLESARPVLAEVAEQLAAALGDKHHIEVCPAEQPDASEFLDVRCMKIASIVLQTGIFLGDESLPTMVITRATRI